MSGGGWGLQVERPIHRMKGRTLGVIGVGRIGGAAARRGVGLGMRVLGYDKYRPADELREMGVEPVGLNELLAESDYVTIHTPLNDETRGLMGREELAKLRPDAILVNTSRGPVIDQEALIETMRNRRIAAAALDVFESEPLDAAHELRSMDNVIVTPHMAGYSVEALADLRADMCNTVAEWIRDSWSGRVLNPEVRDRLRPRRSN
jgi:D-3-phosphoglycerate dehydrogenase